VAKTDSAFKEWVKTRGAYVASNNGRAKHFHRPTCPWAAYFIDGPNCEWFDDHDEAVKRGFKPCKTCYA
jgi:methylphosphotriester-DNA--protein-cysteine methyltransferase